MVLAMPRVARVGDKVNMNCPHGATGTIVTGSNNIVVNGKSLARKGDTITCDLCGVSRTIDSGSPDGLANSADIARVGDPSTGTCDLKLPGCPHTTVATIATGSEDFILNE